LTPLTFIIVSPSPPTKRWGGVCALYQLADALRARGHGVSVWIEHRMDEHRTVDDSPNCVAIIPEVYSGNPTGCKNVVRWILNIPGVAQPNDCRNWGRDDLLMFWSRAYVWPGAIRSDLDRLFPSDGGILFTADFRKEIFRDRGEKRSGACYLIRKGAGKRQPSGTRQFSECTYLDDYCDHAVNGDGGDSYLADAFNRYERFISYDHATMLSLFAAMCGCESIIIPDGVRTVEQAAADDYVGLAGIAWGFDDLPRARATRQLLPERLADCERRSAESIDNFTKLCKERFQG
jgi:hypothetical protein